MVILNCPLCCNETFTSPSSLKCHIEEILENIQCPLCDEKFENITSLAEHLENCGQEDEEQSETEELESSILAKALLEPKDLKTESEEEPQYYCQMCDVHFDDIDEHLRSFHEGQEIIVEEENGETESVQDEEPTVIIINQSGDLDLEEADPVPTPTKKPNTVTEQDIQDKDGRLYTRKFVKIDKFWLQDGPEEDQPKPFIEKFIIGNNGMKKLSDEAVEMNKCEDCGLYISPLDLSHSCQKTDKKVQTCEVCNTTFPTFKSLRLHRRMHEPIKTREIEAPVSYDDGEETVRQMFICKICNKTYDKEYEQVHLNSHEQSNGYNCEVCNRKFYTQTNLEMHMKAHSNNKKFTCSYCKKPFVTYNALNDHLLNQCQKRPYACQYCGRRFARPHEKVKHERIHTGEKPHVCDICGKAFRVSYCLTLHLRTHSGTRPYQCKHCLKRFKSHSVYNHHLLTHSDVRAYKCPYCPKAFKTSVQLAGHKNSHIKPFTCTECNRPFASLYAVRAHMETHKRDNNLKYECWICGALYSRAFALRDHLKQQHQQVDGDKAKSDEVGVDEEMEAANSILVSGDDIILGLDGAANIEIIENEGE